MSTISVDAQRPGSAAYADAFFRRAAGSELRQIRATGWADAYATAKKMQKNGAGRWKVIYYKGAYTLYIEVSK